MLKISSDPGRADTRIFRLEGRVGGPWVAELRTVCEAALRNGLAVTLDVAGVSFIDRQGTSLMHDLMRRGVVLVGSTSFVAGQLQAEVSALEIDVYKEAEERL